MLSEDIVDLPPSAVEPGGGAIVRVLLVHDEPTALTALRSALSGQDIAIVGSTDSGEHALELARILDPDIAMIRWSLRRFAGALTARLMQWHAPGVTPVLLIDADDLDEVDRNDLEVTSISRRSTSSELREALHRISRIGVASTSSTVR